MYSAPKVRQLAAERAAARASRDNTLRDYSAGAVVAGDEMTLDEVCTNLRLKPARVIALGHVLQPRLVREGRRVLRFYDRGRVGEYGVTRKFGRAK